jgi:DNA-binding response OmpR family regulator
MAGSSHGNQKEWTTMATILVVEDDRNMRLLTAARLSDAYHVVTAGDGIEALDIIHKGGVDLIVADIMMPRMDGYQLLKTLREEGDSTPYLMLTAKETLDDKQQGFSLGTDDYMTKPFSSDELRWRIAALLRRANISQSKKIILGSVTVDSEKYAVYSDTAYIEFPKKEFDLLFKLLSYPDRIFSKEQLMDSVWGMHSESGEETVKTHISRIRNRLVGISAFRIITIKGLGYKAELQEEGK